MGSVPTSIEDERILDHAADSYHRIDIRQTSRSLRLEPGQAVIPHGPDRGLTVSEVLPLKPA